MSESASVCLLRALKRVPELSHVVDWMVVVLFVCNKMRHQVEVRKSSLPQFSRAKGAFHLPTSLALVAGDPQGDVVEVVTLVVVYPVGGYVGLHLTVLNVKPKAVAAIVADLTRLHLSPNLCYRVVGDGSAVLEVLLLVIPFVSQIPVQGCFV